MEAQLLDRSTLLGENKSIRAHTENFHRKNSKVYKVMSKYKIFVNVLKVYCTYVL